MRFFFALKRIVCFELLWRLAFLCLVNPLFSGLFHAYVSAAGLSLNGGIVFYSVVVIVLGVLVFLFFKDPEESEKSERFNFKQVLITESLLTLRISTIKLSTYQLVTMFQNSLQV